MSSKNRLFSEDGIDATHSRTVPSCVYLPDESTLNEIKYLFITLKSTQKGDDSGGGQLNICNMPYSADLAMLASDGAGDVLSLEDVINGMCRIATHFISDHQLIQARANAYIRCKLAGAEMLVNGTVQSQNEQSVERDQILLTSATVPSSPRDHNSSYNDVTQDDGSALSRASSRRDLGRDCSTPPPATLFRSPSVHHEHLNTFAPNLFTMDANTQSAALSFLPDWFQQTGFLSRKGLSAYDADKLTEVWDFFDFDDDGIVTRDDVLMGLGNIAKYYLATDDFTQLLTNSYVQRKIRKAVFAIDKYQRTNAQQSTARSSNSDPSAAHSSSNKIIKHEPGSIVIYTDEEGNNHVTKIIRMSQRQVVGGDAYYIETKGVKLCVSAGRLRLLSAQDAALLDRQDSNQHIRQKPQPSDKAVHEQSAASIASANSISMTLSSSSSSRKDLRVVPESKPTVVTNGQTNNTNNLNYNNNNNINGNNSSVPSSSSGAATPKSKQARLGSQQQQNDNAGNHPGDNTPPSASKGGILGYLKSSIGILGIGSGKPVVSAATVIPENQNNSNHSKNKDNTQSGNQAKASELQYTDTRDADSVFEGEDGASYVEVEAEAEEAVPECEGHSALRSSSHTSNSLLPSQRGSNDNLQQVALGETPVTTDVVITSAAPGNTPRDGVIAVTAVATDAPSDSAAALSVTTSQRLKASTAMLLLDGEILQVVRKATGPSYKLTRSMFPKPKKTEPYPIYFNRGKNGFFEFNQVDFGVQFIPFMKDIIPSQDPRWQSHSETLSETNRCFFLHFGVAMGLHPVSLQQCFRNAAAELLRFPENEMTIFFGEALESLLLRNDFVDAQVLSAIWPLEFDRYKVLIVRVDHNGRIESFTSFRSEAGPVDEQGEWSGEELIFTLQWNHFTILKPKSDQLSKPITAVLAAASMIGIMPLEFITKVDPDPSKRFKIC